MQYDAKMRMRCENAKKFASHRIAFFSFKNPKKSLINCSFAFASHYQPWQVGIMNVDSSVIFRGANGWLIALKD
jgi:hypothetical protein